MKLVTLLFSIICKKQTEKCGKDIMDGRKIADYLVQTAPKEVVLTVSYSDNWRLSEGECDSHTTCNVSNDKIVKRCRFFLHERGFERRFDVFSGMQKESNRIKRFKQKKNTGIY